MPSGQMLSSFHSNVVNAETIWEAAEREGLKSAVIHYPASMPARIKDGFVVDGDAAPGYGETRYKIAPSLCYTNLELPNAANTELSPAKGWKGLPENSKALEGEMRIIPKFKGEDRVLRLLFTTGNDGYDRALVCTEKDLETKIADIWLGEWSEWAFEDFIVERRLRRGAREFETVTWDRLGRSLANVWVDRVDVNGEMAKFLGSLETLSAPPNLGYGRTHITVPTV